MSPTTLPPTSPVMPLLSSKLTRRLTIPPTNLQILLLMLRTIFQEISVQISPLTSQVIAQSWIIKRRWLKLMRRYVKLTQSSRSSFKKRALANTTSLKIKLLTLTRPTTVQEMYPRICLPTLLLTQLWPRRTIPPT